jgi:CO dehydrogenase/acetyl-CoA synthase gamma subunit (corrinoid Fe-S protein)
MPDADLYLDRIDYQCHKCGPQSCKDLVDKIKPLLPQVPSLDLPRPVDPALFELNNPGPGDPVLVTGNSEFTQAVLLAVLSATESPFFVLFCDTKGDTLDMAVILKSFTPERIRNSLEKEKLEAKAQGATLTIPGLAAGLKDDIAETTGWPVQVGPVCAAELPLFFQDRWTASDS